MFDLEVAEVTHRFFEAQKPILEQAHGWRRSVGGDNASPESSDSKTSGNQTGVELIQAITKSMSMLASTAGKAVEIATGNVANQVHGQHVGQDVDSSGPKLGS